jgi:hypothetical protein
MILSPGIGSLTATARFSAPGVGEPEFYSCSSEPNEANDYYLFRFRSALSDARRIRQTKALDLAHCFLKDATNDCDSSTTYRNVVLSIARGRGVHEYLHGNWTRDDQRDEDDRAVHVRLNRKYVGYDYNVSP